jgi:hypothetical protein
VITFRREASFDEFEAKVPKSRSGGLQFQYPFWPAGDRMPKAASGDVSHSRIEVELGEAG